RSRRVPSRPSFPRAPPPPHISPLSLHDALPIFPPGLPPSVLEPVEDPLGDLVLRYARTHVPFAAADLAGRYGIGRAVAVDALRRDRKSTRLNSSHVSISYAVVCLKKKKRPTARN